MEKEVPFVIGKPAEGEHFTGQEAMVRSICNILRNQRNIFLLAPAAWGKSSIAKTVISRIKKNSSDFQVHYMDISHCLTTESVTHHFVNVIRSDLHPKLSSQLSPDMPFSEMLALPELIARRKRTSMIICLDGIEALARFPAPVLLLEQITSAWFRQQHCAFLLVGNRAQITYRLLESPPAQYSRFGKYLHVGKISLNELADFICRRFQTTDKHMETENARYLATKVDRHPWYVQMLASHAWMLSGQVCLRTHIDEAYEKLQQQLGPGYTALTKELTVNQLHFLKAVNDCVPNYSSKESLESYGLRTSAHIQRVRNALLKKGILDHMGRHLYFPDPLLRGWLEATYFQ